MKRTKLSIATKPSSKTTTPLKRGTSTLLKKSLGKPKAKRSLLAVKADAVFAHYIRLRDSTYDSNEQKWVGICIDGCGKQIVSRWNDGEKWRWTKSGNVGHFLTRGYRDLRYDEYNCNLQSSYCNAWEDKDKMQRGYRRGILDKYGGETLKELKGKANAKGLPSIAELEAVIHDYKICLDDYLKEESP